jgi:hypothetical protein
VKHCKEIALVVQQRCGREQQQALGLQGRTAQFLVRLTSAGIRAAESCGEVMCLIHDHHAGAPPPPIPCFVADQTHSVRIQLVNAELGGQLLAPLTDEQTGSKHDSCSTWLFEEILAQDNPCLNRLAETHLVGEKIALHAIALDPRRHLHLMREESDARRDETGHP